jgi:disintegrin and metalloproteinase domain-containing protein 7
MVVVLVMVIIGVGIVTLLIRYQKCIKLRRVQRYVYIFCVEWDFY